MSKPGIGVMIQRLFGDGGEAARTLKAAMQKRIATVRLGEDNALHFVFDDGSKMRVFDNGQSCCESRYMRTDDNLADFDGGTLLDIELADAPSVENGWGEHEVQFLRVKTDKGIFTMSSHNEHNGYYGGFAITVAEE